LHNIYLLWSIERVGVTYGLDTIGDQDWYALGSGTLIEIQNGTGTWHMTYGPEVDTPLAILFLARANFAPDLSASLKGRIKDPGVSTLKSSIGSGADLVDRITGGNKTNPMGNNNPPNTSVNDPKLPNPKVQTPDEFQVEGRKLAEQIFKMKPEVQAEWLVKLRDQKGAVNTETLAQLASKLSGDLQKQARDNLADRLTRMTPGTLRNMLRDENREIRRAASLACAMKEDKSHIPDLIATLGDQDMYVVRAARAGLKHLTGQDFGPTPEATPAERTKAIHNWELWFKTQK
jgi:hypothetical protein